MILKACGHSCRLKIHRDPLRFNRFGRWVLPQQYGLTPRKKLLLIGPPGTGKTMSASVLAGELGLPLFVVRLESLITKYMGETAAKLRMIFDAVAHSRCSHCGELAVSDQRSALSRIRTMDRGHPNRNRDRNVLALKKKSIPISIPIRHRIRNNGLI